MSDNKDVVWEQGCSNFWIGGSRGIGCPQFFWCCKAKIFLINSELDFNLHRGGTDMWSLEVIVALNEKAHQEYLAKQGQQTTQSDRKEGDNKSCTAKIRVETEITANL